jgi:hypothetical protein
MKKKYSKLKKNNWIKKDKIKKRPIELINFRYFLKWEEIMILKIQG